jgi:hypothetical protein
LEGAVHAVEQQFESKNSSMDDSVIPTQTGKRPQSAFEIRHKEISKPDDPRMVDPIQGKVLGAEPGLCKSRTQE